MTAFRTLDDADLAGKRVLVRVDLNVPMEDGKVSDTTRIDRILPTIREIADKGGKVVLLAHFGRPKGRDDKNSLRQVVPALTQALGRPVTFVEDCIGDDVAKALTAAKNGDVLLLENTRFHAGDEKNDPDFVKALATNGDLYVNDAFSAAHRAHASTEGLAHDLPAYAGRTMQAELEALSAGLDNPARPVMAIVGGAKVSTKLELLGNLVKKVDVLVIGGGMANTFLAARGVDVGKSLCEHDLVVTAREIEEKAKAAGCEIVLPVDALVAREFKAHPGHRVVTVGEVAADEMILDAGPLSAADVVLRLDKVKTLVWNGPFGAFELPPFDTATVAVAKAAAKRVKAGQLVAVAGGGDTVAAMNHAGVADDLSYVSTAGGAFLEWMEGKALPGVEALRKA
ncbi:MULTISPECIES: phosphoglycerate kinase [Bosea]|uniref:phosphoglycerate kinase n=1 Tax=Bosea TaxID=85413 RepID=UPI00214FCFDC|nr:MULTISPECIES: phosphoglycerate kinase [Bosea]MCR4519960.1 phosphoglycerate kinase [Bosea sp. 47.2.35]MDR6828794.1 phosphoglycerate kinase [Bosea robiniae]MDR6895792.1 phosphoglycerate kinase [Bosea sp. BE109]MDR7139188.1 phosphoglycerate kinase [Bosea sp. BE168]MDR7175774.1 phosphoglycerate kinase [Bosea sp. BE271]